MSLKKIELTIAAIGVVIAAIELIPKFGEWLAPQQQLTPVSPPTNIHIELIPLSQPARDAQPEKAQSSAIINPSPNQKPVIQERALSPTSISEPSYDVAVMIVNEGDSINWDLSHQIVGILSPTGQRVGTPFSEAVVSERSFEKLLGGDTREAEKIGLSGYCQHAILGKKTTKLTDNPGFQDMKTADVSLSIRMISCKTGTVEESLTFSANGPGFSDHKAEEIALERVFQKLKNKISQLTQHL